jgi:hypothetical protein
MRAGGIRDCSLLESGRAATRKAVRFTSRGRANERIGREEEDNEAGRSRGGICDGEGEAWGIRRWGRSSYSWWGSAGEPGEGWSGWESRWTEGGGPPGRQSSLLTRFRQLRPPGLVFLARRSLEWRGQGGRPRLHTDTAGLADRRPDRTASRLRTSAVGMNRQLDTDRTERTEFKLTCQHAHLWIPGFIYLFTALQICTFSSFFPIFR